MKRKNDAFFNIERKKQKTKTKRRKKKGEKNMAYFELFMSIFIYHHHIAGTAGTAARPQVLNPRKMARVTSPSPRLPGKKRFSLKKKNKAHIYKIKND